MVARIRLTLGLGAVAAIFATAGCAADMTPAGGDGPLTVYATTGYLADAVANIAPDAEVTTMVGPGGDPHTYQPSTRDIQKIQTSDAVLWNGLHLEAHMIDQLESLGDRQLAVGDQLPEELLLAWPDTDDGGELLHDPHVWNSPEAWTLVVGYVADHLATIDPDRADEYTQNATVYQEQIAAAAAEAEAMLATVPEPRILITGHDAFAYFGDTYGLDVHATDFISTEAALSAEELSDLASLIAENEVPVIFQDNQANPQAITSLQEAVRALGWDVEISDEELYADSLGADAGVDTYLGVFAHNATAVAEALGSPE
ncbi:metal ABC transporter substrate-binding protein [Microbacterium aquimaris]|uniref:Zinc ABC transporter substrate-binding protein n=1 Tax=Microbacterium aquimaris TaxID=459816 RepID=A0ABU5N3V0_9MICO|nr:zinc ABC transporter substrate-binding protein [Microbacterium aquimaris]MDZ8160754.1 zinc ABC transporter substrate-binding protein [Microbacterium aquimaris]